MRRRHVGEDGVLLFGKYRGKTLREVTDLGDADYLVWAASVAVTTDAEREQVLAAVDAWEERTGEVTTAHMMAEEHTWD